MCECICVYHMRPSLLTRCALPCEALETFAHELEPNPAESKYLLRVGNALGDAVLHFHFVPMRRQRARARGCVLRSLSFNGKEMRARVSV